MIKPLLLKSCCQTVYKSRQLKIKRRMVKLEILSGIETLFIKNSVIGPIVTLRVRRRHVQK